MNLIYYAKNFGRNALPEIFFKKVFKSIKEYEAVCDKEELNARLAYYFKSDETFEVPEEAVAVKDFKKTISTTYFFDLKEFLHFFKSPIKFAFHFGDETHVNSYPTLFKARPINGDNANSILFKLNKRRHFKWVNDNLKFTDKKSKMVWRGKAWHALRTDFVKKFYNNPLCNVGQVNKLKEDKPWVKGFLTLEEQLKYKFIFCPEGNDVATNLKWVLSSNSLCIMPKPNYETWFMEGTLVAGVHYVEVEADCSNLEEKLEYYSKNDGKAQIIIDNANKHVKRFQNKKMEDLLCLKVLEKYAVLSNQKDYFKF
ncbi:lipopolysaccharide A protein [Cellulophaga baltica]|nr:lipopolysaccharide A protein [Cellulophaga baltica]